MRTVVNGKSKKRIKESAPSNPWNKETTPLGKMAFDAVFDIMENNIDWELDDFDADTEKVEAERNKFYQVMQGIYHAVEQFTPEVEDFMNTEIVFERKF